MGVSSLAFVEDNNLTANFLFLWLFSIFLTPLLQCSLSLRCRNWVIARSVGTGHQPHSYIFSTFYQLWGFLCNGYQCWQYVYSIRGCELCFCMGMKVNIQVITVSVVFFVQYLCCVYLFSPSITSTIVYRAGLVDTNSFILFISCKVFLSPSTTT